MKNNFYVYKIRVTYIRYIVILYEFIKHLFIINRIISYKLIEKWRLFLMKISSYLHNIIISFLCNYLFFLCYILLYIIFKIFDINVKPNIITNNKLLIYIIT